MDIFGLILTHLESFGPIWTNFIKYRYPFDYTRLYLISPSVTVGCLVCAGLISCDVALEDVFSLSADVRWTDLACISTSKSTKVFEETDTIE